MLQPEAVLLVLTDQTGRASGAGEEYTECRRFNDLN